VVPGYFERLLDHMREADSLAAGYREVYLELAIPSVIGALIAVFLRQPRISESE
jgi:hypothetical protein